MNARVCMFMSDRGGRYRISFRYLYALVMWINVVCRLKMEFSSSSFQPAPINVIVVPLCRQMTSDGCIGSDTYR